MRIIYSPEFNSTSYINLEQRKGQLLGLKVCGSTELLSELELRAGIAHFEVYAPASMKAFFASTYMISEEGFEASAEVLMALTMTVAAATPSMFSAVPTMV